MSAKFGSRMVLAVEWDVRQLRLVHAGLRKGHVKIERMLAVDMPPEVDINDPVTLGGLLRQVLSQQRIRTDRVLLDVPRDQVLLTTLQLPAAAPEELPALVEFQIVKEIPFPLTEAVVDFALPPGPPPETGRLDVLVGTARRDVVGYYEKVCAAAGLKLERLGLRPYANKVAVNELYGAGRYKAVAMVDVGPRLTEIDVIAAGRLAFSRAASVPVPRSIRSGSGDGPAGDSAFGLIREEEEDDSSVIIQFPASSNKPTSDLERVVQAIVVEVTRSIEAYRATPGSADIEMIVVAGATGLESRLAEALGGRYRVSAELYNPARPFGWAEERGREARAFAASLGLVTGHATEGRLHFDFLHPKKTVTATARRLRKAPAVVGVIVLVAAAIAGLYFKKIAPAQRELRQLAQARQEAEDRIKELKKVDERVLTTLGEFKNSQVVWLDELVRLAQLLPDNQEMVLTRLDMYHKGSRINLQLEAMSEQVVHEAAARINAYTDQFAGPGRLKATVGNTRRQNRPYPVTGSMDIEVNVKAVAAAAPAASPPPGRRESPRNEPPADVEPTPPAETAAEIAPEPTPGSEAAQPTKRPARPRRPSGRPTTSSTRTRTTQR